MRYTRLMTKFILVNHSIAFSEASRPDIRKLYFDFIDGSRDVIEKIDKVLVAKGLFPKSPYIQFPDRVDYVHNKSYYGSVFGGKRSLNVFEISNIFANLDFIMAMRALVQGFIQVINSDELKKHFSKGKKLLDKCSTVCLLRIGSIARLDLNPFGSTVVTTHIIMTSVDNTFNTRIRILHFIYLHTNTPPSILAETISPYIIIQRNNIIQH